MNQQELSRRIQNISKLLGRIEQIIYSLQRLDPDMYPNDYLALCTEAALLSERATCLTRNIVYTHTAELGQTVPALRLYCQERSADGNTRFSCVLP